MSPRSSPATATRIGATTRSRATLRDAYRRFARQTLCILDNTTPDVTQVTLATGVDMYTLHPKIVTVLTARHQDDQQDLVQIQHSRAANNVNANTEDWDVASITTNGKPRSWSVDEGGDVDTDNAIQFRVVGVPDSTQDGKLVYLRTARKPLVDFSLEHLDQKIEIPEDWELDWIEFAAWRALRNWDLDAQDRQKADAHKARFEEAVKECRREMLRKHHKPVKWGFGGPGFTYTR
jgi:hypothetical protein